MNDLQSALIRFVDSHMGEIYDFLGQVIHFDTTNYIQHGREKECQDFIFGRFREMGVQVEQYTVADVPEIDRHPDFEAGRGLESRPNVTVAIPCEPECAASAQSLMLASHVDTMPAGDLRQWQSSPFELSIRNGRAYGLGISDDKYGAAVSFAIARAVRALNLKLKHNLFLSMVADEEYFGGGGSLLACLRYPCSLYVNMDGSDFEPQIAGLGGACFELALKCESETASAEPVVDALYRARVELGPFAQRRFAELESNPLYKGSEHAKSAYRLMEFGSGTFGTDVDLGKLRIVVYTTLRSDQIRQELDDLFKARIEPYLRAHSISSAGFRQISRGMAYAETRDTAHAFRLRDYMAQLSGKDIQVRGACLSDLDIYLRDGSPDSFNVGLIREFKMEGGAHKPNEWIDCKDFENIIKALLLFAMDWCQAEIGKEC